MNNKVPKKMWSVAHLVADMLYARRAKFVLVGSAGLAALGYDVSPDDLDFMLDGDLPIGEVVGNNGDTVIDCAGRPQYDDDIKAARAAELFLSEEGVKVNFLTHDDEGGRRFFSPVPEVVDGILVSRVEDIVGLKFWADRPKDQKFFVTFPELRKLATSEQTKNRQEQQQQAALDNAFDFELP